MHIDSIAVVWQKFLWLWGYTKDYFGLITGFLLLFVFINYGRKMIRGTTWPHETTQGLWAFLMMLNCAPYLFVGDNQLIDIFLPSFGSISCLCVFIVMLYRNHFHHLNYTDAFLLVLGTLSGFVLWRFDSVMLANAILQTCIVLSFYRTYDLDRHDASEEELSVWARRIILFVLLPKTLQSSLVIMVSRSSEGFTNLVYPINCVMSYAAILVLVRKHR